MDAGVATGLVQILATVIVEAVDLLALAVRTWATVLVAAASTSHGALLLVAAARAGVLMALLGTVPLALLARPEPARLRR